MRYGSVTKGAGSTIVGGRSTVLHPAKTGASRADANNGANAVSQVEARACGAEPVIGTLPCKDNVGIEVSILKIADNVEDLPADETRPVWEPV